MDLETIVLIALYAIAAYILYRAVTSLFKLTQTEEDDVDLTEFVNKVVREYNFQWRDFPISAHDQIEAFVCGKTGYVLAKIVKQEPFYSAYFKGQLIGDYVSPNHAKEAINTHLNFITNKLQSVKG